MAALAYEQLLTVQDLDLALLQFRHRHANHPIQQKIAEIDDELAEYQITADEISGRRSELSAKEADLASEVTVIEAKRAEIDAKLYDGSVTGTKDLLALQDEAKMLVSRQSDLEDAELEIMEQVEQVDAELAPVTDQILGGVARRAEEQGLLAEALTEIEQEITASESLRVDAVAPIPSDLLSHYESLRDDLGGVAVARLVGSTCDGCHMALSAVSFDKIKRQDEDALVNCDQCGRILIR